MRSSILVTVFSVLTISLGSYSSVAHAQEESSSKIPQDQRIEQLRKKVEEAELLERLVRAQRGQLPQVGSASEALDGKIDLSNDKRQQPIENQILAYEALKDVSQSLKIALFKKDKELKNLIVYDDSSLKGYALYGLLDTLKKDYSDLISNRAPESGGFTLLETPTAILRSVVEFLALFRTNTEIYGVDLNIPKEAFVAQLASDLNADSSKEVKVFYPQISPMSREAIQGVIEEIRSLSRKKVEANQKLGDSAKEQLASLNAQYDELMNLISAPETRQANFLSLVKGYRINQLLSKSHTYILYTTDIVANGSNQTKQSLFSSRLRHSGGVIINYILLNRQGDIELSDTLYSHTGFVKVDGPINSISKERK